MLKRNLNGLQALRMIAAILVLITHSTFYAGERLDKNFPTWGRGTTGVDLFFVLSGFVMAYSSTALLRPRNGWKIFIERRLVRIVPMYWLATSLKLGAMLLTTGFVLHAHLSVQKTLYSYFFLPSLNMDGEYRPLLGVGWTLNFEMFFYVIFALALFFRRNVYWFVGLVLTPVALGSFLRKPDWPAPAFYLDPMLFEFLLGMLLAKVTLSGKQVPRLVAIPAFFGAFLLLLAPIHALSWIPNGVAATIVVACTIALESDLGWLPRWSLFLGDASYVIYLFHPLVAPLAPSLFARMHIIHPWFSVACSVVIALSVGSLIHYFVEAPVMDALRGRLGLRHRGLLADGTEALPQQPLGRKADPSSDQLTVPPPTSA